MLFENIKIISAELKNLIIHFKNKLYSILLTEVLSKYLKMINKIYLSNKHLSHLD